MAYVLAQVAVQRLLQAGIQKIKENISILDEIFAGYNFIQMESDYGQTYINDIKTWFAETKIPVVQAWAFDPQRIPIISVHLSSEGEDEAKASFSDYFGSDEVGELGVNVFGVSLDIGIHTSKTGDEVLWLYYIVSYILFKNKRLAEYMGLQLQTFSATDYQKNKEVMADNIWSRWIKFRCVVQNFWEGEAFLTIDDINATVSVESVIEGEDSQTVLSGT